MINIPLPFYFFVGADVLVVVLFVVLVAVLGVAVVDSDDTTRK